MPVTSAALVRVLAALALAGCASQPPPRAPAATLGARPVDDRAPAAKSEKRSEAESSHDRGSAFGSWRTAGWITLGVAGVAAAVTGGTSYLMLHDDHVRDNACNADKQCSLAGSSANAKLSSLVGWNIGAWAITGVAAGVGTILVLTHPVKKADEPAKETAIGISPTLAGAALTLRSSF